MDMNNVNIEEIVKQVLAGMSGNASAPSKAAPAPSTGSIPKTARVAMLTALEHYDIKEFPIPPVGDDDILVKVEGCGICGGYNLQKAFSTGVLAAKTIRDKYYDSY